MTVGPDPAVVDSLARAIASDRQIDVEVWRSLAERYLEWRVALPARRVQGWEDRAARRYVEGA